MHNMSAINRKSITNNNTKSNKNSTLIVCGVIAIVGIVLFAYLMWYVTPEENLERVKIIAVTESGCIAETSDGFAVNIGSCEAQPDEYIVAQVDQKVKERAAQMNPTN